MKTRKFNNLKPNSANFQCGATLIEILISILLMSIGLLGMAGLQLSATTYQKNAESIHKVAEIINDFAERIRANPTGAKNGEYTYIENYITGKDATFTSNNCRYSGGYCSTAQIAADDLASFIIKAQTILPKGSAQVTGSISTGFTVTTMYFDKDFVDPITKILLTSATCVAQTGIDWRNCCPATASAPAGVRCRRFNINP